MNTIQYRPSAEAIQALMVSLSMEYQKSFDATEQIYKEFATDVPMDEKGLALGWMTSDDDLRQFGSGRVIKQIQAHGTLVEVEKFEKTIGVSYDDLRDSKYTQAQMTATGIGRSTKRHPDRLCTAVLETNANCADGLPLFGTHFVNMRDSTLGTYSNDITDPASTAPYWYLYNQDGMPVGFGTRTGEGYSFDTLGQGSDQGFLTETVLFGVRARVKAFAGLPQYIVRSNKPLTAESFEEAFNKLESIVGPEGQPINNSPTKLMAPKKLRAATKRVIGREKTTNGMDNEWHEAVKVVINPYATAVYEAPETP